MIDKENIYVFPILKKTPDGNFRDDMTKEELDKLVFHYMRQLVHHLANHEMPLTQRFFKDYNFVHESFKSLVYRQAGLYHPLQETLDSLDIPDALVPDGIKDTEEEPIV